MNGSSLSVRFNYFWHFMVFPLWFVILYVTASKDKHVAAIVLSSSLYLLHGIQRSSYSFLSLVTDHICQLSSSFWEVKVNGFQDVLRNKPSCALRHESLFGQLWSSFLSWNRADNVLQQSSCFLDAQIWLLTVFLLHRYCLALSVTVRSSDSISLKMTQLSLFSILLLN